MRFVSYLVSLALIGLLSTRAMGQTVEPEQKDGTAKESEIWEGVFADGTPLTHEKLKELLASHLTWVRTIDQKLEEQWGKAKVKGQDRETWTRELLASDWGADQGRLVLKGVHLSDANLRGAYLKNANLENANLNGVQLPYANLEGADLNNASLVGAYLGNANLKGIHLSYASLEGADLRNASLEGAYLGNAKLKVAKLWNANLERANLAGANLDSADLGNANLEGAYLPYANLDGALYEPKFGRLPEIVSRRTAENLEMMRFGNFPHALEDLRREFKKAGFKEQERQVTYAIKRSEQLKAQARGDLIEPFFNYVFFDLPVAYGLRPGRALWILVSLIPGFALFYGVAMWKPLRNHGLYRLWPKERIETKENGAELADAVKLEPLPRDWRHALGYAVYFSVLSAFHIGWRELNPSVA